MVYTDNLINVLNAYYNHAEKAEIKQSFIDELNLFPDTPIDPDDEDRMWIRRDLLHTYEDWFDRIYPYIVNFGNLFSFATCQKWNKYIDGINLAVDYKTFPYAEIATDEEKDALEKLFSYSIEYKEDENGLTKYVTVHKFR